MIPDLLRSSAARSIVLLSLVAACALAPASSSAADSWDLPEDLARLVPADAHVVLALASLDEANEYLRQGTLLAASAANEEVTEPGIPDLRELLGELAPALVPHVLGDRPLVVTAALAPMMANEPRVTLALPMDAEALDPDRLAELTGGMAHRISGDYVGVTPGPSYPAAIEPSERTRGFTGGVVSLRVDLATLAAMFGPMVNMGLAAASQQAAADTTGEADLDPETLQTMQAGVGDALAALRQLDLGLGGSAQRPHLEGALTVVPGSVLDPGPQVPFERALDMSGYLPADAAMVQATAFDVGRWMREFSEPYRALMMTSVDDLPEEMRETYADWITRVMDMEDVWGRPCVMSMDFSAEGMSTIFALAHEDAGGVAERMIDLYSELSELGIGMTLVEGPAETLEGHAVRVFTVDIDPERFPGFAGGTGADDPSPEDLERMMSRLHEPMRLAVVGDRLLFAMDRDPGAMAALIRLADAGRPLAHREVEAAAGAGAEGVQSVTVMDLRRFVSSVTEWIGALDGKTSPIPSGEPVPVWTTAGLAGDALTFSLETDLEAFVRLVREIEEADDE